MKKALLYLMIMVSMVFADDCYFAKVAARKAQDRVEEQITEIKDLKGQIHVLQNQMNDLYIQMNNLIKLNNDLNFLVNQLSSRLENAPNKKKIKAETSVDIVANDNGIKVVTHTKTPENLKAIPNKPLSEAPKKVIEESTAMKEWRKCAQEHSKIPCLKGCLHHGMSQRKMDKCDQDCTEYQRKFCGVRPAK